MTSPQPRPAGDRLNGFPGAQRDLYSRIADADGQARPQLLDDLADSDLLSVQRMVYATGDRDFKPVVEQAVLRRPHRGAWPLELDRDTRG